MAWHSRTGADDNGRQKADGVARCGGQHPAEAADADMGRRWHAGAGMAVGIGAGPSDDGRRGQCHPDRRQRVGGQAAKGRAEARGRVRLEFDSNYQYT